MSTASKVIIKFQLFSLLILALWLTIVNYGFWQLWLSQYYGKVQKLKTTYQNLKGKWWPYRSWQFLDGECFEMYEQKYCLDSMQQIKKGVYKSSDKYFLIDNNIAFDITDFFELHLLLVKLSFYIVLFYLIVSYPLGRWFLASIYSKLFEAIRFLKNGQLIDMNRLGIAKDDELYFLFQSINNQFDAISSFNRYLSHEIKTPLMNLLSSLEILYAQWKINEEDFEEFKKEIFHIKSVIDMFGRLMILERWNLKIGKESIDICNFIKSMITKQQIKVNINCEGKPKIPANEDLLKTILFNLFSNIKKYSKGGASIYVDKDGILIQNKSQKIKNISKLTQKFYKEGNKSWMGIGLYLVKKAVELLGWTMDISFDDGIFKIYLKF